MTDKKRTRFIDESGKRYGKLEVIAGPFPATCGHWLRWRCRCDCGKEIETTGMELRRNLRSSCGCWRTKHGQRNIEKTSGAYRSWIRMKVRCNNKNYDGYKRYGAVGIEICDRWSSFEAFFEDMGPRPEKMTLDRIDPFGNYSKENCRWATAKEQIRNRKGTVRIEYNGSQVSIAEFAEIVGIPYATMLSRHKHGWSAEEMCAPVTPRKSKDVAE